jgi:RHS repeat-associated protein
VVHTASYDLADRITSIGGNSSTFETYTYDAGGNRVSRTDGDAGLTTWAYDARNRPISTVLPDGTTYNATLLADGRRTSVVDARGTTSYTYDAAGRIASMTEPDGSGMSYGWNGAGQLTSRTVDVGSSTEIVTFTYDSEGLLDTVTDPTGGVITWTWDISGRPARVDHANGSASVFTRDAQARLIDITHEDGTGTPALQWSYTWVGGELVSVLDLDATTTDYTYDSVGRLLDTIRVGTDAYADDWTWDGAGNIVGATLSGSAQTWSYDALDRITSRGATTYTWDGTGRATSRNDGDPLSLTWSGDRLSNATSPALGSIDYIYDIDGLLVSRTEGGVETRYLWDRSADLPKLAATYDGATLTLLQLFVYGGSELMQVHDGVDVYTAHTDRLGTLRGLTDATGAMTDTWTYDAWGNFVNGTGIIDTPFGFTRYLTDDATGFDFAIARWYEPASGRFLSRDPIGGDLRAPLTLNRYLYGRGEPVHYLDPDGRFGLVSMSMAIAIVVTLHTAIDLTFGLMALQRVMRMVYGQLGYKPLEWDGPEVAIGVSVGIVAASGMAYLGTATNDLGTTTADVLFAGGGLSAGIGIKLPGGSSGSGGLGVSQKYKTWNLGQTNLHPEWPLASRPNPFPLGSPSMYIKTSTIEIALPAGLGKCAGPSQTTVFTGAVMSAASSSEGGCSGPGGGVSSSAEFKLGLGGIEFGASSVQSPLTP